MFARKWLLRMILALLILLALTPLLLIRVRRPPATAHRAKIFQGVVYSRQVYESPRVMVVHVVEVDLTAPGIAFWVTPGVELPDGMEYRAQTTAEFLRASGTQLALNANFFTPFHETAPWDFYPRVGDPVDAYGLVIAAGVQVSAFAPAFPVLCIRGTAVTISEEECAPGTEQAIAGNHILVMGGQPARLDDERPNPRTAVGLSAAGQTMWWVVVDGRQSGYSEGATLAELAAILAGLGADRALNLDGGGSTTLVKAGTKGAITLNAPIHTRLPTRQRPVANHLGLFALPIAHPVNE